MRRGRAADDAPGRRLFVAVPIPTATRDEIAAVVEEVRAAADPAVRDVRWVRLEGLHLTLRFLGPTTDDRLSGVVAAVDRTAEETAPFPIEIGGAGAFPSIGRPRILWFGVLRGYEELAAAAARLDDGLAARGWPREDRPFRAHLTLARSDGVRAGPQVAERLVAAAESLRTSFVARSVVVLETVAGRGPARYETVHEAVLA
ncbi:MAG TPA: RNA 2',3'-cyclic phosphodiesterase [Candidatus Limnocylindrales bacterium]|nr:RNA 2',3'-cyclic phosphodiesterase [Candidatus Limnocylindrales bacterium]